MMIISLLNPGTVVGYKKILKSTVYELIHLSTNKINHPYQQVLMVGLYCIKQIRLTPIK